MQGTGHGEEEAQVWAIVAAIVAGLIGFAAKIGNDIRTEHEARKAIAAAIAGELGAYLRLSDPAQTAENIMFLATIPYVERAIILQSVFSNLPSGHPVFDRIADRIGTLSPQAAHGISEAYNIITSMRLHMTHLASENFGKAPDDSQKVWLKTLPARYLKEISGMQDTVALLDRHSRQRLRDRLRNRPV
jgi:hypothetical protein